MSSFGNRKYYDPVHRRLVYAGTETSPEMWDECWSEQDLKEKLSPARRGMEERVVVEVTRRYLPRGARVLEGGCGLGQMTYLLRESGYEVVGVDYAARTVERVRAFMPDLDVRYGDLERLDFDEGHFDGYWSFGVIEHLYHGYERLAREMVRVLRPGGYLFVTVPALSALRRLKAALGLFPRFRSDRFDVSTFYQFAFSPEETSERFGEYGFQLVERQGYNVYHGVRDEIPGTHLLMIVLRSVLETPSWKLLTPLCNHMDLFVFRKPA
jgi:SAM-dependent methyltransferase